MAIIGGRSFSLSKVGTNLQWRCWKRV